MFTFVKISRTYTKVNEQLHSIIEMNFTDDLLLGSETNFFSENSLQNQKIKTKPASLLFQGPNTTQKVAVCFCFYLFLSA